jgi:hypothetical protein
MKPVPGICDRCGQRYPLSRLSEEYVLGRPTGVMVCRSCYDESHPQLDTRHIKTNDKQYVKDSRSDKAELAESRRLHGWRPVGHPTTSTLITDVGRVTVYAVVQPTLTGFVDDSGVYYTQAGLAQVAVNGTNFTPQSVMWFDDIPRATTYVSTTEIRCWVDFNEFFQRPDEHENYIFFYGYLVDVKVEWKLSTGKFSNILEFLILEINL